MTIQEISRNVHVVKINYSKDKKTFPFLLSSDHHWDNPDCDRAMIKRHLEWCKKEGALAFFFGDFFCAMQGKYDKRSDKSKIRPEHQTARYLDSLVDTAADWLMPYREQIGVIGLGNHETAILKNHETHLIERLVERLNAGQPEHRVYAGGYGGYIKFEFSHKGNGSRFSKLLKYHHGHGGGGPVTKGVIQSQRNAAFIADADIVVSGHVHEQYLIAHTKESLSHSGKVTVSNQWHVRTPTYKDEYKDGYGGWHIETGKMPKPLGAWKLIFDVHIMNPNSDAHFDFLQAR